MKRIARAAAIVLLAATAALAKNSYRLEDLVPDPENWNYEKVKVVRALDGDTVELEDGRKVRLLGVNAPEIAHNSTETAEPGAQEAWDFTAEKLVGKTIRLYTHKDHPTDQYGRTLGLVFYWTGGSFNIDLIEETPAKPDFLWLKPDLNDPLFKLAENPEYGGGGGTVNVNTADAATLDSLPGIGPSTAAAIVAYREANGPFGSLADLDKVPGIGPATLEKIDGKVSF